MAKQYFSGQGYVDMAVVTAGTPAKARWIGNATSFKIMPEETIIEHKESYTGNRSVDLRKRDELKLNVEITFDQIDLENLKQMAQGDSVTQTTSPVSAESLPGSSTPAVGDVYYLANVDVGSLVITDSTGSPKTLTLNTNYSADTKTGRIVILDVTTGGAFTGPLKAAYTPTAETKVKFFSASASEYWVWFSGVNTAVSGSPTARVELYRVSFSPTEIPMITEDANPQVFTMTGTALVDSTKTAAGNYGQYGSFWTDGLA